MFQGSLKASPGDQGVRQRSCFHFRTTDQHEHAARMILMILTGHQELTGRDHHGRLALPGTQEEW